MRFYFKKKLMINLHYRFKTTIGTEWRVIICFNRSNKMLILTQIK